MVSTSPHTGWLLAVCTDPQGVPFGTSLLRAWHLFTLPPSGAWHPPRPGAPRPSAWHPATQCLAPRFCSVSGTSSSPCSIGRAVGRPPAQGYEYCVELGGYQADTWKHSQRLILVVVDRPDPVTGQLNLLPHYFFLITNWSESERSAEQLLDHYRARGTFEDRLGEFNQVIGANLSSQSFEENETTMLMALLAFNLANIVRSEHENVQGSCMDLKRFQSQVLKAGAIVVKHSHRLIVRVANRVHYFWHRLNECISNWKLPARSSVNTAPNRRELRPPPSHAFLTEVIRP